jgi:UDP-N-acetylglucosamine 2-epimerase (non-hydrolysing)
MKKLLIVVGTRPNYIKISRFKKLAADLFPETFDIKMVHTGQHFNKDMADIFFQQLDIWPDYYLNIPPSSPNTQMAEIMLRLEKTLSEYKPDWVIVPGDVNSTAAAALCAHKCNYKLAHLEGGLRSFDLSMPEEINRIMTDQLSDIFFVTEQSGIHNLLNENKRKGQIHFVGNTMIDTLVAFNDEIENRKTYSDIGVKSKSYALITMHRPATVDSQEGLEQLCNLLSAVSNVLPVIFPIHPRTKKKLKEHILWEQLSGKKNLISTEPMNYFDFQNLVLHSKLVMTDSGGIQEETTFRKIPCLTLRPNTERPITITTGTNTLISFSIPEALNEVDAIIKGSYKSGSIPDLWDGKSTERILKIFDDL